MKRAFSTVPRGFWRAWFLSSRHSGQAKPGFRSGCGVARFFRAASFCRRREQQASPAYACASSSFFFCRWMRYGGAFTGILTKILCRVTYRCVLSLNLVIKCGLDGEFRFLLWIASALSFAFGSAQPFVINNFIP